MNDPLPRILHDRNVTMIDLIDYEPGPFSEMTYLELMDAYAGAAFEKKQAGAAALFALGFTRLSDARACVLGMRQTKLPVYVSLCLMPDGETSDGTDPLAALICLQELGLHAFGLDGDAEAIAKTLPRILPYAKLPVFIRSQNEDQLQRAAAIGADSFDLTGQSGQTVSKAEHVIVGCTGAEKPPRPEDSPLLLADEAQVYYLEEDFTLSEPIDCELDIAEQILDAEAEGYDALLFHIKSHDDVLNFARDGYMARRAACFLAESEELLDLVLVNYSGRAIIDSRSDIEPPDMEAIARGYGAVIR